MIKYEVKKMGNLEYERLHENLKRLKLDKMEAILDNYLEIANKKNLSIIGILDHLIDQEYSTKETTKAEFRTRVAGFPFRKTFEQFDFSFQPSIDKKIITDLCSLRFVYNAENVIFLGPPGVGKTHLAIALGMEAIRARFSVYYISAHNLMEQLTKANHERNLTKKLQTFCKCKVLIIDEIGYLPFDKQAANLFFQLISKRYEKLSTILTSNKPFSEWDSIFGDNVIASAILDRLLHHCTPVNIKGQSYRLKDRQKTRLECDKKIKNR
jgi:DNA replication protein DnaC